MNLTVFRIGLVTKFCGKCAWCINECALHFYKYTCNVSQRCPVRSHAQPNSKSDFVAAIKFAKCHRIRKNCQSAFLRTTFIVVWCYFPSNTRKFIPTMSLFVFVCFGPVSTISMSEVFLCFSCVGCTDHCSSVLVNLKKWYLWMINDPIRFSLSVV